MPEPDLYAALSAPFEHVHSRPIGGGEDAKYLTGEQVISRLNRVLGPAGWSFEIVAHGLNAEADEFWVHGCLTVHLGTITIKREQFGSQKIKRAKSSGTPLDIGFDEKGAATDALKKCGTLLGIGLDLTEKAPQDPETRAPTPQPTQQQQQQTARPTTPAYQTDTKEWRAITTPAVGTPDWTKFWVTLKERGLEPDVVTQRLGGPPAVSVQHGKTLAELLDDPRLQV